MDYTTALKILGIKSFSSQNEKAFEKLKKKYRTLAKKHHPDAGGSEEKFKELNAAYAFLLKYAEHSKASGKTPQPKPKETFATFKDFRDFLLKHEHFIIEISWVLQELAGINPRLVMEWLDMAKDLHYIQDLGGGEIGIEYIPPQITINRFYFMHSIKVANGFRGNKVYKEAEEKYRKGGWKG